MRTTDSFGYWLRRRRKALDLTQAALGAIVGCTEGMIRRIEADERRPSPELAARLADALAVPATDRAPFLRAARGMDRVDQLDLAVLPTDPPPARALPAPVPAGEHSLPAPTNALIGRAAESAAIWALLIRPAVHLVTLTGPGGSGKTRLAIQVASELLDQFPGGISFVDLAPVSDPEEALPAIAAALGLREQPGLSPHDQLVAFLRGRRLLLLDNLEQILAAGPQLAALLAALPALKLLVTSRFPLRLQAEQEYPVPPLDLPARPDEDDPETISQAEAVQLFLARARPERAVNPASLVAIAAICRALDGLPLAIELAAAWARIFTPEALLARLDQPLAMLVGGPRDAPARQQALRTTIDWSYRLLGPDEQAFFRRLGVCVGGWTIETAEALAAHVVAPGPPALHLLRELVEGHMIMAREGADGEPRFGMLETLREYALEQLAASGELAAARRMHATYFADLAARAEPQLHGFESRRWMDRLEADWDNLRAALRWSREAPGAAPLGLALMGASWWFWELRGRRREAREWLVALLEDPATAAPTPTRARALFGAAYMADNEGDHAYSDKLLEDLEQVGQHLGDPRIEALILCERGSITREVIDPHLRISLLKRSLTIFQQIGDQLGTAWVLCDLGIFHSTAEADAYLQAALDVARMIGDTNIITMSLMSLGERARDRGALAQAQALLEEAVAVGRAGGDLRTASHATVSLGTLALARGNLVVAESQFSMMLEPSRRLGEIITLDMALTGMAQLAYWRGDSLLGEASVAEALANSLIKNRPLHRAWLIRLRGALAEQRGDLGAADALLQDSLARYRALDDSGGIALALASLGHLWQRTGDLAGAAAAFRESITRYHSLGYFGVATCLVGLAALAESQGSAERAARLWGAAEHMGAGSRPDWADCRPDDAARVAAARAHLSAPDLAAAWAAGAALTTAEAVAETLGDEARGQ